MMEGIEFGQVQLRDAFSFTGGQLDRCGRQFTESTDQGVGAEIINNRKGEGRG